MPRTDVELLELFKPVIEIPPDVVTTPDGPKTAAIKAKEIVAKMGTPNSAFFLRSQNVYVRRDPEIPPLLDFMLIFEDSLMKSESSPAMWLKDFLAFPTDCRNDDTPDSTEKDDKQSPTVPPTAPCGG